MSVEKVITTTMSRRGWRSSRWAPRADVKRAAKKRRRAEDKRLVRRA